ncbi:MAG: TonB-dependent siderophore receptor [Mesorhizobium sp.]|uniref:TonB-dependent receptor n=1 Tax=unclassified Mesorhizobium TaxID=325217 RepID=UPI000FCAB2A7|nr:MULTISPECIES: TonB-dependent siderophore receptor [unclassified Mesorhizobium]RUV68224.1 TonB-dependent siderophore receptor [Mesorhizobium sp. M5C.F.Cr.IN.023.01.1.1]RWF90526.1 MAG: TonB-dependent siderophore receptor [Mesorhizobium sp.]RWF96775.1 MAG: TonB-dependent siderophore receptor [Mesorhizobium sp.]RWI41701.1 MAG: TonB-dependent siderophore receptor [Mesorhizobium sp.]RWI50886.1 MAG: TonB-dependent siderophore receptor [Mesorhizobium sp.]
MRKRIGLFAALVAAAGQDAAAQEATRLQPIVVEASDSAPATATIGDLPQEYPGGQVAKGGRLGLLGNRDVMDTPFNITTYTAKTIEDQGARTAADVMLNDPSVRNTHSSGGIVDSFYIRGFPINEGNLGEVAFDGVFGVAPAYRLFTDYAERIEVLKGPAALLYGIAPNSSVGGIINVVPKRAGEVDLTRVTTDYASDLQGGAHVDVSRRFGTERQFGVRFNGSYHGGDTPIDDQTREVSVGSLALDYQGERLRATLDVIGQREDFEAPQRPFFPLSGFAIPEAPDSRLNVQQPWEWSKLEDLSALGRVEYDLTDQVTLFAAAGGGNSRVERLFGTPILLNTAGDVSITPQNFVFDVDRITAEAGLRARFDTGAVAHLFTLQANHFQQSLDRGFNSGATQFTNIYDPVPRLAEDVPAPTSVPTVSESELYGFALADTLSMFDERVQLILGGRWQHIESENFHATSGAVTSSSDQGAFTPLVGLVVKPWENVSLYANYVEGLSIGDTAPGTAINAGETLAPYRSRQIEVGTKIDFGRIAVTVSAFQIEKPFGQLESRGSDLVFVEGGEQRNRGLEFNVFGEVTPDLRLLGGVTLLHGKLTKRNSAATLGNTPIGVPSVQVNLGAEWDTPFLEGLTLAANVIHTGKQNVDTANTQEIPSWTRLDLGARYLTEINDKPVTFRASVENVFDSDYWAGVASFGTLAQGAPMTVKLSMTTDF